MKTKILIVEDQILLRDTLACTIGGQTDMEVAGVTDDATLAPELCRKLRPDLALIDVVTKNNSNGIKTTAIIRKKFPGLKIVIMTSMPEITFIDEARKAGAHSFIYKNAGTEHLLYTIRSTMKGVGVYPGPEEVSPIASQFSETELAVIRLVCQGKTRNEMKKELDFSESTLGRYITAILDKSGFDSITKFAVYAVSEGFILPDVAKK